MTGVRTVARRFAIGFALAIAATVLVPAGASQADAAFSAQVEAQTLHVTISNDQGSIPTLKDIDAGIGSAQASFSSYGGGVARAASPDAGSAASLPGLLAAVGPTLLPVPLPITIPAPPVPGDITVQGGEPASKVGTGPYELDAAVTDSSATAKASLGGTIDDSNGALQALSVAKVSVSSDQTMTAVASSDLSAIKVSGLVTLGDIQTTATVSRDPDGTIHRDSSLDIGNISIAGVTLSFHNGQFVSPLGKVPVPLDRVASLLSTATAGLVKLSVEPSLETSTGVTSGSLQLSMTFPAPPKCIAVPLPTPIVSGVTYCGKTTVVYDFGRTSVSTDYKVIPAAPSDSGSVTPPADSGSVSPGTTPPASGSSIPGAVPPLDASVPPASGTLPVLTPPTVSPKLLAEARFVNMSNVYLGVVGFALLTLISSTCIRLLGVRNAWKS